MSTVRQTLHEFDLAAFRDDDSIEEWVAGLRPEQVVEALYLATKIRRSLYQLERMATSRILADGILAQAEVWTSPDGVDYFWGGDRHREVKDPDGLKAALAEMSGDWGTLAKKALAAAFRPQADKVYLTELDKVERFADQREEVARTIRSFAVWVEGSPKLRPVEQAR